ncbi:alpha/beta fold hydrolase [Microlunatus soli]|uniref:Pimeloyl-ACP methyl ester carboxylesterase n=1 Tax=Microlunatus soli TaxID=630515 RepID=A0A1H1TU09_9ACTN|nr:alpha/beta hydrolase [Microlunatus soli]SDS63581.1 Pimeloyl-ACP methyl ester carboxylesterase [Microlunatus soli]
MTDRPRSASPFDDPAGWIRHCHDDSELAAAGRHAATTFAVRSGDQRLIIACDHGRLARGTDPTDFELVATPEAWKGFFEAEPEPLHHHFLAMRMRLPGTTVDGDERSYAQHAGIVHRVLALGRELLHGSPQRDPDPMIDRTGIREQFVPVEIDGAPVDLHVTRAGSGVPLLVLHTAGADGRQAHALMADPSLTDRYEVIAFDLPWHGSSGRLPGPIGNWTLTTQCYGDIILAVIAALELDRPILLGASMAGEICLEMAHRAPKRFRGVIACEASERVPGRTTAWARDPRVDTATFVPEWIAGLIAPRSPQNCRDDILWTYSQSGAGTFAGDIDFYSGDWDGRDKVGAIDTETCPVIMMTGQYDYSCTPTMSERTAARIPGAVFWEMAGLGHFPICENPSVFAPHLERALHKIDAASKRRTL